mmetsp:Transcript_6602/g.19558  ORF Transcript_6602/g.19558 Transcript_6602/m.19558 type:complete len:252 (-) Transcript_6602:1146-1901(-)
MGRHTIGARACRRDIHVNIDFRPDVSNTWLFGSDILEELLHGDRHPVHVGLAVGKRRADKWLQPHCGRYAAVCLGHTLKRVNDAHHIALERLFRDARTGLVLGQHGAELSPLGHELLVTESGIFAHSLCNLRAPCCRGGLHGLQHASDPFFGIVLHRNDVVFDGGNSSVHVGHCDPQPSSCGRRLIAVLSELQAGPRSNVLHTVALTLRDAILKQPDRRYDLAGGAMNVHVLARWACRRWRRSGSGSGSSL